MNEILAVMKQMENVPDPPVTWRQISKEQRCSYCRAIAGHWTEALRQKSKSLPRKLSEGEYMDTLHKACEDSRNALPADQNGHTEQRQLGWLCEHILETVGEEDVWDLFLKQQDIPAKRLCTRMMRLCPKGSSTEF
ncbi:unnamed protein product [Effrenium voratum]|nr:unnamed protein product [Effrenium voratum]